VIVFTAISMFVQIRTFGLLWKSMKRIFEDESPYETDNMNHSFIRSSANDFDEHDSDLAKN
jgi:hypothetical protein